QQLSRQDRRDAGWVVGWRNLYEIHSDDVSMAAPSEPLDDLDHFVIGKATVAGCSRARCNRRIETIYVDRDVVGNSLGYSVENTLCSEVAYIAHRQDVGTRGTRGVVILPVRRRYVADPELGHADD